MLRLRGGPLHTDSPPQPLPLKLPPKLPPLPGRTDAEAPWDDDDRDWPRVRKASRTSSPSSDGIRSRCKLLLRLGGWLALARLALGGRVEADEDVAPD